VPLSDNDDEDVMVLLADGGRWTMGWRMVVVVVVVVVVTKTRCFRVTMGMKGAGAHCGWWCVVCKWW
jgi:hypothetical protein